jgi:hypothetical protein
MCVHGVSKFHAGTGKQAPSTGVEMARAGVDDGFSNRRERQSTDLCFLQKWWSSDEAGRVKLQCAWYSKP